MADIQKAREHALEVAWRNYVIHKVTSLEIETRTTEEEKKTIKLEEDILWSRTEKKDSERSNYEAFSWYIRNESQNPNSYVYKCVIAQLKAAAIEENISREEVIDLLGKRAGPPWILG
jgi:hypothetical protein